MRYWGRGEVVSWKARVTGALAVFKRHSPFMEEIWTLATLRPLNRRHVDSLDKEDRAWLREAIGKPRRFRTHRGGVTWYPPDRSLCRSSPGIAERTSEHAPGSPAEPSC